MLISVHDSCRLVDHVFGSSVLADTLKEVVSTAHQGKGVDLHWLLDQLRSVAELVLDGSAKGKVAELQGVLECRLRIEREMAELSRARDDKLQELLELRRRCRCFIHERHFDGVESVVNCVFCGK